MKKEEEEFVIPSQEEQQQREQDRLLKECDAELMRQSEACVAERRREMELYNQTKKNYEATAMKKHKPAENLGLNDVEHRQRKAALGIFDVSSLREYHFSPLKISQITEPPPQDRFRYYRRHRIVCTPKRDWFPSLVDLCHCVIGDMPLEIAEAMVGTDMVLGLPEYILNPLVRFIRNPKIQALFLGYTYEVVLKGIGGHVIICHKNQDPKTQTTYPDRGIWYNTGNLRFREVLCYDQDLDHPYVVVLWRDYQKGELDKYFTHLRPGHFNFYHPVGREVQFDAANRIRGIVDIPAGDDPSYTFSYGTNGVVSGVLPMGYHERLRWITKARLCHPQFAALRKEAENLKKNMETEISEFKVRLKGLVPACRICAKVLGIFAADYRQKLLKQNYIELEIHCCRQRQ